MTTTLVRKTPRAPRDRLTLHDVVLAGTPAAMPPSEPVLPVDRATPHDRNIHIPYFTFPVLEDEPWLVHAAFTRRGGTSEGYFSSLNMGAHLGDDPAHVAENYRRVGAVLGVPPEKMVFTDQKHTTNVRRVTAEDAGKGATRSRDYTDTDALVTDVPGLLLGAYAADCVPLLFADPVHRAIGVAHSGWRGTVGRIGARVIKEMREAFGTEPTDLLCGIAPSICQDCYEVGEDVAEPFRAEFPGHENELLKQQAPPTSAVATKETTGTTSPGSTHTCGAAEPGSRKSYLDLWAANRIVLTEAGVPAEHIRMTDICTCCQPDILFSHRASGGKRGLLGIFIGIRE